MTSGSFLGVYILPKSQFQKNWSQKSQDIDLGNFHISREQVDPKPQMGPECFNLTCIVGISYAEPLNTEAFDLFKIPLTVSERAGKIIGNVANCNSHNGKPGNPIISNNE